MGRAVGGKKGGARLALWVVLLSVLVPATAAPLTPSGTVIRHNFQLRYLSGTYSSSLASNETRVTIQDLLDPRLVPPRSASSLPGQPVDFLHTITNRGNAKDSFLMRASLVEAPQKAEGAPLKLEFYASDGLTRLPLDPSGLPVTPPLEPGASFDLILRVTPPPGSEGRQANITVSAASQLLPGRTSVLLDQLAVPVSDFPAPVLTVTPAGAVLPGTLLTYRISFTNVGGAPATGVLLSDPLDPLLEYLPGSATFPVGAPGSAAFDAASRTLAFALPVVSAGFSGSVTFQARARSDAEPGQVARNRATLSSDQNPLANPSNTVETPIVGAQLLVGKVAGSAAAEVGDIVSFTLKAENRGSASLDRVTLRDSLPRGLRYLKGSSLLDGDPFADPDQAGRELSWELGTLPPGVQRLLSYRVVVSGETPEGQSVNRVQGSGTAPGSVVIVSAEASARVLIRSSLLGNKAIILGRVFLDTDGNGIPDPGEPGVPGVRIYLDDGSFSFTDPQGQYSFTGVSAGNHVVKIDRITLPRQYRPVPYNTAFAGVGWSQFITVPFGGPARGDFALALTDHPLEPPAEPVPPAPAPSAPEGTVLGAVERLRVAPDRVDLPADGKSIVPFTVELLTREGRRVAGETTVTIHLSKAIAVEPDADPARPGHQLRVRDGVGVFHLRAALETGADPVRIVAPNGVQGRVDLFLSSELRDWIVVGLGSFMVGGKAVSGQVEKLDKDDRFEEGLFHEERLSFFTRGKILGKYLITAAYDSGKERREGLFQYLDPERYYPVYGDASDIGYEAQSTGKLYVKLEAGRSYLVGGDFRTDLSENEFSRYDRALNGAKLELNLPGVALKGFGSRVKELQIRDQFPGDGTSGYYFLSRRPVFENSERVRIETRDRYHTERILSVVEKVRYADYSIDYGAGTILFKEPVPSRDKYLNPITVVVIYQSDQGGEERYVYGGRALAGSAEGNYLGGTAVVEEGTVKDNTLFGVDAGLRFGDRLSLRGEGAVSDSFERGRGSAWKSELFAHPTDTLDLGGYYRRVEADFFNRSMTGNEFGTEKYGGRADYRLLPATVLTLESFVERSDLTPRTLFANQVGVSRKFSLWDLEAGYKRVEQELPGENGHSDLIYAGGRGLITPKLEATLRREQLLSPSPVTDYQTRSYLRLDYRLSERTRAFLAEEYQEGSPKLRQATLLGLETKLSERMRLTTGYTFSNGAEGATEQANADLNTRLYEQGGLSLDSRTGYQLERSLSGERGEAILGLNSRYEFRKGLFLSTSFERVQSVHGDGGGTGTAFTLAGEYLREKELKLTGRYEIKSAPGELASLYGASGAFKLSPALTLLAKSTFWDRDADLGHDLLFDGYLGSSWRPTAGNPWQFLALARFRLDHKGSVPGGERHHSLTLSGEPTYRLTRTLSLQGKYAGKISWDRAAGGLETYSDLALAGISYDLAQKWELSLYLKVLNQYQTELHGVGAVGSVGYRVYRNVVLMAGYNYARLDDRELTGEPFQGQGPFVGVKVKFDEEMFETGEAKVAKLAPPRAAVARSEAVPLPVIVPALAIVGEKLERPLDVSGSAELFTLLVNGSKARLPSTEVSVTREELEGSVELENGRLKRPVSFLVALEKPEQVASWSFTIMDGTGRTAHTRTGAGAPGSRMVWNGETDGAPLVQGEVYQYQMELTYRDGSSFSTARGLFGVSRHEAMLLSLSGGAFVFESARLTAEAKRLLSEAARVIRANPREKVIVEGHTDAIGTHAYNMGLSKRRCDAAADYLMRAEGIPAARLIRRWYGKSRPVADNVTTPGRRMNRRVELKGDFPRTLPNRPDRFRTRPFVVLNGRSLPLDPEGRFATTLPADVGRLKVEMGDSLGRTLATVLPVPGLRLAGPAGELVVPYGSAVAEYEVDAAGGARCRLKGGTDPDTTVELDGKVLPVAADGSFSAELPLAAGDNVFGMVLKNGAGCSRLLNLRVRTQPHRRGESRLDP